MGIRRVVTGHDAEGKAVFVSDEEVEPAGAGASVYRMWAEDEAPTYPNRGVEPPVPPMFFPDVGGFRFFIVHMPPDTEVEAAAEARRARQTNFGGVERYMEADEPGMHTTDTIDLEVVLSGEITLELDDGVEKVMRPGDTMVQNGTRHRWHNRGSEPAVFASIVLGAHRDP